MSWDKWVLVMISLTLVQSQCAMYQCKPSSMQFATNTCVSYSENTYNLQVCPIGQYCRLAPETETNSSCFFPPTIMNNPPPAYVGEICTYTTPCLYGNCSNGLCRGLQAGADCTLNAECDYGLYCSSDTCTPQIAVGDTGCTMDYECVNNAGCNVLSGTGTCVEYYSIGSYETVGSCVQNQNMLCESSYCVESSDSFQCLPALASLKPTPVACQTDSDCVSLSSKLGSIQGNCTCGFNPTAQSYCSLFMNDSPAQAYLTQLRNWVQSAEILECSSERRFEWSCLNSHMTYPEMNEFTYYQNLVTLYPVIQGADNCTWNIYFLEQQQIRYEFVSVAWRTTLEVFSLLLLL